jgi:hypothetical protein
MPSPHAFKVQRIELDANIRQVTAKQEGNGGQHRRISENIHMSCDTRLTVQKCVRVGTML